MNAVVLLAMPLASWDSDASAKSVKSLTRLVEPCFDHLDLTNAMVSFMMPSVSS